MSFDTKIHFSKKKYFWVLIVSIMFVLGGLWIITNEAPKSFVVYFIGGWMNIIFFGIGFLISMYMLLSRRKIGLLIDDKKVTAYNFFGRVKFCLGFKDIKKIEDISEKGSEPRIAVYVHDYNEQLLIDGINPYVLYTGVYEMPRDKLLALLREKLKNFKNEFSDN